MPSHLPSRSSVAVGRVPKAAPRAAPDLYLFPLRLSPATWLGWRRSTYAIREPTVTATSEQRQRNAWNPAAAEFGSCAPPHGSHALFARHISRFPPAAHSCLAHVRRADDQLRPLCVLPQRLDAVSAPSATSDTGVLFPVLRAPATLLHPPVARAPVLARATPRLSRRCRSFSSFFSSRTRSCVEHGRKGLWFHRRCRGKWSCQKGLLRRHLY